MRNIRLGLAAALLVAGALPILAQPSWNVTNTFHIGGDGGWDYVTVDAADAQGFCYALAPTRW